jgi:hypothetical protein
LQSGQEYDEKAAEKVSVKKSESGQFSTHEIEQVSDYATSEHKHQRPCRLYATARLKCLDGCIEQFDHLDYIEGLREDHTQQEIADKMGWTRSTVADYGSLLKNVVAQVLEIAKTHEQGRATGDVATATFTEGWFRTSGLYDLNREGTTEYATPDEDEPKHAQCRLVHTKAPIWVNSEYK